MLKGKICFVHLIGNNMKFTNKILWKIQKTLSLSGRHVTIIFSQCSVCDFLKRFMYHGSIQAIRVCLVQIYSVLFLWWSGMISVLCIFSDISTPLIGKNIHVCYMLIWWEYKKMHKVLIRKGHIFYCRFRRNRLVNQDERIFPCHTLNWWSLFMIRPTLLQTIR